VELTGQALEVLAELIGHVRVRTSKTPGLLEPDFLCATDLAEHLVAQGVPFADAHALVGRLVAAAEQQGKQLRDMSAAEMRRISPKLTDRVKSLADPMRSVQRKQSLGSTNPRQVQAAIAAWQRRLRKR
jgi:argininosuccinate lyase